MLVEMSAASPKPMAPIIARFITSLTDTKISLALIPDIASSFIACTTSVDMNRDDAATSTAFSLSAASDDLYSSDDADALLDIAATLVMLSSNSAPTLTISLILRTTAYVEIATAIVAEVYDPNVAPSPAKAERVAEAAC